MALTFKQWLQSRQYSQTYQQNIMTYAEKLYNELEATGGAEFSQGVFDSFFAKYPHGMGRNAARLIIEWLRDRGTEYRITFPKVRGRPVRKVIKFLRPEEITQIIEHKRPDGTPFSVRDRLAATLLFDTGLRASEACALKWDSINFDNRTIQGYGKGRVEYVVNFGKRTHAYLLHHKKAMAQLPTGDIWVFPNFRKAKTAHISRERLWEIIVNMTEEAGFPNIHPHIFRHSIGTAMGESGADTIEIARYLRHKKLETAGVYIHASRARVDEAWGRVVQ